MGSKWDNARPPISFGRKEHVNLSSTLQTDDARKAMLERWISEEVQAGWKVQHQSSYFVALVKGKRPNHILHLLLSIFTLGFWLPVWLILGISMGERRQTIEIDKFGNPTFG
jgi:hypothetical protein